MADEEFVVYTNTSDDFRDDFQVHVQGESDNGNNGPSILTSEDLFFIHYPVYHGFLETVKGQQFMRSMTAWVNFSLPFDKKITNIESDMRDGIVFSHLLEGQGLSCVLPHDKPSTPEEKKENLHAVVTTFGELDLLGTDRFSADEKEELVDNLYSSEGVGLVTIFDFLIQLGLNLLEYVENAKTGTSGPAAIEQWLQEEVGMSGNLFCNEFVTTNLEDPENLIKLFQYCPDLGDYQQALFLDSSADQMTALQDLLRKETGVPALLDVTVNLEDDDVTKVLHNLFLRYLWAVEISISVVQMKNKKKSSLEDREPRIPKEIIIEAVTDARRLDEDIEKLEEKCREVYSWVQSKITLFKNEIAALTAYAGISNKNITLITDLYKIMSEEQNGYSKLKHQCYAAHAAVQRSLKNYGRDVEYHPLHNIFKVEDLWNRLVALERNLEGKLRDYLTLAENKSVLYKQWESEVNSVKNWMKRWEKYFAQIECENNTMSNPDLRKTLKTYKQKFLNEVEEMNHTSNARMLSCLCTEFALDEDTKEDVEAKTSRLCEEYEEFLADLDKIVNKINKKQEDGSALDVMYNEMSDLLSKLDDQIHELFQYYHLRPPLKTVSSCDKLSGYVKETWGVLFEMSYELDAALSLDKDMTELKEKLGPGHPVNYLTTLTPNYISQRWTSLLIEARNLEDYIIKRRNECIANRPKIEHFDGLMKGVVSHLNTAMLEISDSINLENKDHLELLRTRSDELKGDLTDTEYAPEYLNLVVEATPFTMTRQLQEELKADFYDQMQNIRVEAVKLPNSTLIQRALEEVLVLENCAAHCFSTLDLVMTDSDACNSLFVELELRREDYQRYKQELDSLRRGKRLVVSFPDAVKGIVKHLVKKELEPFIDTMKESSSAADPLYNRVTLSAWINMRCGYKYSTSKTIEKDLRDSFTVVAGYKKYVSESDMKKFLDVDTFRFALKRSTEYFGPTSDKISAASPNAGMMIKHRLMSHDKRTDKKRADAKKECGKMNHDIAHLHPQPQTKSWVMDEPWEPIFNVRELYDVHFVEGDVGPGSASIPDPCLRLTPKTAPSTKPRARKSLSAAVMAVNKNYDYNRLITNLVGGRQKLSVEPDHDSFYFAE